MDTNRRFVLWSELLPEMRLEIRARMPKITQFILASTCKQERAAFNNNKSTLISTNKQPLVWQLCQTIVEDVEPSFEWLIPQVRKWLKLKEHDNLKDRQHYMRTLIRYVGIAIGKSGNLKWWKDDRLYSQLPQLNEYKLPPRTIKRTIYHSKECGCRDCYLLYIANGLAKADQQDVFFSFYEYIFLATDKPCTGPPIIVPPRQRFVESAARYGRLDWLKLLITTITGFFTTTGFFTLQLRIVADDIILYAIQGGHIEILEWFHSNVPDRLQNGLPVYSEVLINRRLPVEKTIEVMSWLYKVAHHPLPEDFLYIIMRLYILSGHQKNPWKVLEFARSLDRFAHDKTNMPPAMRDDLNILVENFQDFKVTYKTIWESACSSQADLSWMTTPETILDWMDKKIANGKATQGH